MPEARRPEVALQMYSVREAFQADPAATFRAVAEAGYRRVELSGHEADPGPSRLHGLSAQDVARLTADAGLEVIGGQVTGLTESNVAAVCDFYQQVGASRIVVPIAYFPDRGALEARVAELDRIGARVRAAGMELDYVNHYHEFQEIDGVVVLDALLDGTAPEHLSLTFNPYWVFRGGLDPIEVFHRYERRIAAIEIEDYPADEIEKANMWEFWRFHPIAREIRRDVPLRGGEIENFHPVQCRLFAEVGTGVLDIAAQVAAAAEVSSVRYVLVRQDFTRLPSEFDSVAISLANVAEMGVRL